MVAKGWEEEAMENCYSMNMEFQFCKIKNSGVGGGFPGGPVVKNLPANAGDMGSSPGPERYHMPRSN